MKTLLSNIRLPWLLFTLLVFSGLVKLGLWQTDRAQVKQLRLDHIAQLSNKQALSLEQVLLLPETEINDLPIMVEGQFDQDVIFLLDNQVNKGRLGYRVYQIINVNEYAVLVNLGWVLGSINRQELPDISPITGQYKLKGNVRLIETGIQLQEQKLAKNKWPLRVQQVELDKFSQLISSQLLPFVVYLDKTEGIGYEKNWRPIVMLPEKHSAYAFQWFSLAVAWLTLMIWAFVKINATGSTKNNTNNAKNNSVNNTYNNKNKV